MKKIALVDGSSYLYRAFYGLPPLTGPREQPTGVLYGVVNMLRSLIGNEQPDYFAVVFDPPGETFRHRMYASYKANRPRMPDDLSCQIPPLFNLIEALGYPMLQIPNVEADDVIGTIARKAKNRRLEVVISTGDKDLTQLVCENTSLINTMKNERLDAAGVSRKMGVTPRQVADYLALTGDKSDNIPGVTGVGPKTAARWLGRYETLEAVMEHASEIKGKAGDNLQQALPHLRLSRELTTIQCNLDIPVDFGAFRLKAPDTDKLKKIYTEFGFKKWLSELPDQRDTPPQAVRDEDSEADYHLILKDKDLDQWMKKLNEAEFFALGVETDDVNYMQANIIGIAFATHPKEAAYIPFAHKYEGAPQQLERSRALKALKPLLESVSTGKVGHDLKHDRNVLANHDIRLSGIRHDSMLESYVHDSVASSHDIDSLAARYLGITPPPRDDVTGGAIGEKPFAHVAIEAVCPYVARRPELSLRLHEHFWPRLEKSEKQKKLYEEIEIPLVPVLSDMERHGVLINSRVLEKQSDDLKKRISELKRQSHEIAGEEFNLDSPVQIRNILFEKNNLPVLGKTPKGQPSTAENILHELAQSFELPRLILDYRMLSKLRSTYTDKLPQMIHARSGRIHTSYHQAVTATGRLSSSDPNLQNIPVRTPEGRKIRQAFTAPPGYQLLAADYSQIELRIMAHLSGDRRLRRAFEKQQDIHLATAAEIFSVSDADVTPEQRRSAKAINFGLIYGMSSFGLAKQLGLDFFSAKKYIEIYFQRYPEVQAYMKQTREKARESGYVETLFGRRLYLPDIRSRTMQRRRYAERAAINAPMQGTAADIMKRAMVALHNSLRKSDLDARMIMQVHDELLVEVAEKDVEKTTELCDSCMSGAAQLEVPLVVVIGKGHSWDEAH